MHGSGDTVPGFGDDGDDLTSMLAHVPVKGSLAHVERAIQVQVDYSREALAGQLASGRHELATRIILSRNREKQEGIIAR